MLQSGQSTPEESDRPNSSVDVNALCLHHIKKDLAVNRVSRYPPITGTVEERCKEALSHIAKVLYILLPLKSNRLQYILLQWNFNCLDLWCFQGCASGWIRLYMTCLTKRAHKFDTFNCYPSHKMLYIYHH